MRCPFFFIFQRRKTMDESLGRFLQLLLEETIRVLMPILLVVVIGWVTVGIQRIRKELGEKRWQAILDAVRYAIYAAEQSGLSGQLAALGQSKKEFAIEMVQDLLTDRGIQLDVQKIASLIEGELGQTINWKEVFNAKLSGS